MEPLSPRISPHCRTWPPVPSCTALVSLLRSGWSTRRVLDWGKLDSLSLSPLAWEYRIPPGLPTILLPRPSWSQTHKVQSILQYFSINSYETMGLVMSPFWACVFPSVKWSERYHSPRNVVRITHNTCKAVGGAWHTIRCLLLCKNCSKMWWLKTAAICYLSRYWGLSWGDLCTSWWWWAHSFGCIQLAVSLGRLDLLLQLGGCLAWQSRAPRSPGRRSQLTLRLKLAHLPFWCMLLVKAKFPRPAQTHREGRWPASPGRRRDVAQGWGRLSGAVFGDRLPASNSRSVAGGGSSVWPLRLALSGVWPRAMLRRQWGLYHWCPRDDLMAKSNCILSPF